MATTTIRDYSTTFGGGFAVVHVEGCDNLRRSATEVQAMSKPGTHVTDERYHDAHGHLDPRSCARSYARKFTVDFPIHFCGCAEQAVKRLDARRTADMAANA